MREERGWSDRSRDASQVSRTHCSCERSLTARKYRNVGINTEETDSLIPPCGVLQYCSFCTVEEITDLLKPLKFPNFEEALFPIYITKFPGILYILMSVLQCI